MSSPNDPPVVIQGVTIDSCSTGAAITMTQPNTMTIDTAASIRVGSVELTEKKLQQLEAVTEFIERFTQENQQAREIWTAIKTKKRILG